MSKVNNATKPELAAQMFSNLHHAQRELAQTQWEVAQTQRQLAQTLGDMTLEEISEYQRIIAAQAE